MPKLAYRYLFPLFALLIGAQTTQAPKNAHRETPLPYQNPALPVSDRVNDLLARMTPEEKFRQLFMVAGDLGPHPEQFKEGLFGFQVNTLSNADASTQMLQYAGARNALETALKINEIQRFFVEETRLGIPIIAFDEALHGLVRTGATAFPQSIALAATWDTSLMQQVAGAIAVECRMRGIRLVLSPVINLATDPRWGRVEETYGEDPVLSAAMGVAYVKTLEEKGVVATPKHFAVNHGDGGRDSYPIDIDERLLDETYLYPFKEVVQKGRARSIMTAYNSLNGRPCTANDWLLNEKLKGEWGFNGFVISDASATGGANVLHFTSKSYEASGKQAIENGLDVIFQTGFDAYPLFSPPFLNGGVDAAKVDSAVARVLRVKFELGLFEHPYIDLPPVSNDSLLLAQHALAQKAAVESFVLLKNDHKKVLPLGAQFRHIALIGTDAAEARLGGYSGPGNQPISLLNALKQTAGLEVGYAPGCGRMRQTWEIVPGSCFSHEENGANKPGLEAQYFNNISLSGMPVVSRIDPAVHFQWTLFSPHPDINYDFFSGKWSGYLTSPATGTFQIGIDGNDGYRLYLNDKLVLDTWEGQSYHTQLTNFYFEKNKPCKFRLEYRERSGNAWLRLIWNVGVNDDSSQKINEAVEMARNSDVIVVAAGIEEGEFQDRSHLGLPGRQEEMIGRLAALGKPMVVLLYGGSAVTMPWLDQANAVLDVWYPGEAGGAAIADVLLGKASPSGKLPITFPMHEGQLPLTYNHKPTGRGDDYRDGTGQPLFPFGYGLSYSSFEYGDLTFSKNEIGAGESTTLSFTLKNTGSYDAAEVVQLYITDVVASMARPVKALKAFQRVYLKAGESTSVRFTITPEMLSLLDEHLQPVVEPGEFRVMLGGSSKDVRLREVFNVTKEE